MMIIAISHLKCPHTRSLKSLSYMWCSRAHCPIGQAWRHFVQYTWSCCACVNQIFARQQDFILEAKRRTPLINSKRRQKERILKKQTMKALKTVYHQSWRHNNYRSVPSTTLGTAAAQRNTCCNCNHTHTNGLESDRFVDRAAPTNTITTAHSP